MNKPLAKLRPPTECQTIYSLQLCAVPSHQPQEKPMEGSSPRKLQSIPLNRPLLIACAYDWPKCHPQIFSDLAVFSWENHSNPETLFSQVQDDSFPPIGIREVEIDFMLSKLKNVLNLKGFKCCSFCRSFSVFPIFCFKTTNS